MVKYHMPLRKDYEIKNLYNKVIQIVERLDEPDFVMRFAVNFMAQATHLFFNCFTGQLLMNSSGAVSNYMLVNRLFFCFKKN